MKNLNYKWVLLIGAVLGLIVGTFNKDEWETIPMEGYVLQTNHTTGETWIMAPSSSVGWKKRVSQFMVAYITSSHPDHKS